MFHLRAATGAGTGTVVRAGRFEVGPAWRLPLRITDFHALFVGHESEFRFTFGPRRVVLRSGETLWIPRHLAHHAELGSNTAECHVVHFELHPRDEPPPSHVGHWTAAIHDSAAARAIDHLCGSMVRALAEQTSYGNHQADAQLNEMLAVLSRNGTRAVVAHGDTAASTASVDAVAAVLGHIASHVCEPLRISELAALAGLHRSHFSAVFTRLTGLPPSRYVTAARLAAARDLLETTDLTLDQIASRCGFDSASHLARRFHQYEAIPPGQYRSQHATTQRALGLGEAK